MFLFFASFACSGQLDHLVGRLGLEHDCLCQASWTQRFQTTHGFASHTGLRCNLLSDSGHHDASTFLRRSLGWRRLLVG